ncbi:30S ribosomal protein S8 [Mycoplasma iguanae]
MITDPIADMIVRLKNASSRKHKTVSIPYSGKKVKILDIIKEEGYIFGYEVQGEGTKKSIIVNLKYKGTVSAITGMKKISKPGLKVYSSAKDLPVVLSGFGTAIVSTSKGFLTDKQARKEKLGGEVIAYVW